MDFIGPLCMLGSGPSYKREPMLKLGITLIKFAKEYLSNVINFKNRNINDHSKEE
jgi:hypothetical protein